MKSTVAMACVAVAWFVSMTSSLLLCDCPSYPAIGIPLAALAIWWLPGRRWRLASILAFFACVIMTSTHAAQKVKRDKAHQRILARANERAGFSNTNMVQQYASTNIPVLISTNQ